MGRCGKEGRFQFDPRFPPQAGFNGVQGYDRPRPFDDVPAMAASAVYLDDRIEMEPWQAFGLNLQAGLRADLLHGGGWWFSGVRDAVLQPRLNLEAVPRRWLRLRAAWGKTAKLPPLGELYPAPQFFDVVNVNYYAPDPAERLAVLTTYVKHPSDPDLGFSRASRAEAGIEVATAGAVVGLVGFRDHLEGGIGVRPEPTGLVRDHYELTDSVLGNGVRPEIVEPPSYSDTVAVLIDRPSNDIREDGRGLELTALMPEIAPLHTRVQIQASWVRTERRSAALYFGPYDRFTRFQLREDIRRTPYWRGATEVGERAVATYRIIHQQAALGLVVTATIQHNLFDRLRDIGQADTLAFEGYLTNTGELVPVPASERTAPEYRDLRVPRGGILRSGSTPADWMLSLQVQKTLPLDGRLAFWAFNAFDRPGILFDPNVNPRGYPALRFGLELSMPARGLTKWMH